MIPTLTHDVRYALRTLGRQRGFTVAALLTLALGIGASTAVFSVVDGILLSPLPYPDPSRLVAVWPGRVASLGELDFVQRNATVYAGGAAAFSPGWKVGLAQPGLATQLSGARVSTNFLDVLGVRPEVGRNFRAAEGALGFGQVVLLSDALWRGRFGGDPAILGRSVVLDGEAHTVIGVMPADFRIFQPDVDLWMPLEVSPASPFYRGGLAFLVGRLAAGATREQAQSELRTLTPRLRRALAYDTSYGRDANVIPLRDALVGDLRVPLLVLLAAVGFIVLIGAANVSNLLLARTMGRRREISLRTALGATHGRIVRLLLTESGILAAVGGALGLVIGAVGLPALRLLLPPDLPRLEHVRLDLRVLAACAAITVISGLLFAAAPAVLARNTDPQSTLRGGGGNDAARNVGRRLRGSVVVTEIALTLVLLVGASLMIESMWHLVHVDPGFRPSNVLSLRLQPTGVRYDSAQRRARYFSEVLDRVRRVRGVATAGAIQYLPLTGYDWHDEVDVEGRVTGLGVPPLKPGFRTVAGDYFGAMGIPLRAGRLFTVGAGTVGEPEAIVNEAFAHRVFDGDDATGHRFRSPNATDHRWVTIIGVVGNVRHVSLAAESEPEFYLDERQFPQSSMAIVIRSDADALRMARQLETLIAEIDPTVPISEVRTLDQLVFASLVTPRIVMALLSTFAAVGLVLGSVGIYGVVSYGATQRVREIGVRMALGAARGAVVRLVVRGAVTYAVGGVMIGLGGALFLTRAMRSLVYGVSTTDPPTYAFLSVLLIAVATLASWIPALRAARIDPAIALRQE